MPKGIFPRKVREVISVIGPSIAYIPLTRGQFSLIDSADSELLGTWNWAAYYDPSIGNYYATRSQQIDKPHQDQIRMHRLLLGIRGKVKGDHANRNPLDNRRSNLRVATDSQNGANKAYRCNRSGYKGVSWNRFHQKYRVQIKKDNRVFHLGYVDDPKDGHAIYCAKALELHGEFAKV